ncbi:MAG: VacJ family lipoprotein [Cytophagales bacterium]|nr:VacJ family lipoprotein [Cytophagales bacterium]
MNRIFRFLLAASLFSLFAGCATGPNANPADPLEPMNRAMYKFNDAIDGAVLKPVATGYKNVVPSPIRQGVSNFFSNLGDVWSMFNHLLQFEFNYAGQTAARLGLNTFLGLGGVLDLASDAGIQPPKADLGQTFGKWGIPSGPFVMLPLLGPSSVRDGVGTVTATYSDPVNNVPDNATRNVLTATRLVDIRAKLLGATDAVDEIALDKYSFIRDVYLKRRQSQIKPEKPSSDDDIDYSVDNSRKQVPEQVMPKLPPLPITLPSGILK